VCKEIEDDASACGGTPRHANDGLVQRSGRIKMECGGGLHMVKRCVGVTRVTYYKRQDCNLIGRSRVPGESLHVMFLSIPFLASTVQDFTVGRV